jgi:threonine dehydrogenase-like Zn-dependent dehydrogenase
VWAGNPDSEDIVARIAELEPLQLDAVFECCGEQEALDQAVQILKPGGKLMVLGIPSVPRVSFDVDDARRKEISILYVRRQVDCVAEALQKIDRHELEVDALVTHRFPFESSKDAFELVADYRDGVVKALVEL